MVYYGVDYYPEHWPKERWATDARLMQEANINVIRVAEFAWSRLEPAEGTFDFAWLDEVINLFADHGIQIVLGTPTAAPPAWLTYKHPDVLLVDAQGRRAVHGTRRHVCLNSPAFRDYTERIVTRMAERYGKHAAVIGWQIDNELGWRGTARCFCSQCHAAWHAWLKDRYGSIERLNKAWGTVFWSQTYTDWKEVPLPWPSVPAIHNPSLVLNFCRFSSDVNVRYLQLQADILRRHTSNQFITHNLMGLFGDIDYYDLARALDFVSWDNYPRRRDYPGAYDPVRTALAHDVMRSVKKHNFWVMEEQVGPTGQDTISVHPHPGEVRLWVYQAIAHGADGIVYFRWRTCRYGQEQFWHGVLDTDGVPRRRYEEVKQVGHELAALREYVTGSRPRARVAIIYSYDNRWAFSVQRHHDAFDYVEHLYAYYRFFHERAVAVDLVAPGDDLTDYALVVAPALHLVEPGDAAQLERFVRRGGVLVLTFRSGVKDGDNVLTEATLPGLLRPLVGATVEEYTPIPPGTTAVVRSVEPGPYNGEGKIWLDGLEPREGRAIAVAGDGPFAGRPVIVENRVDAGAVYYIGTWPDEGLLNALLDLAVRTAATRSGFDTGMSLPSGISWMKRVHAGTGRVVLFGLNFSTEERFVAVPDHWKPLVGDKPKNGILRVPPYGVVAFDMPAEGREAG